MYGLLEPSYGPPLWRPSSSIGGPGLPGLCYKDDIDSDIKNNELLIMELFGLGDLYSLPRLKAQIEAEMK